MGAAALAETDTGKRPAILLVAPQPFYQDRGTPIAVRHVIETLCALGCEVDVLTYPMGSDVTVSGSRVMRLPNPLRFRNVAVGFSWRKLVLDAMLVPAIWRLLGTRRYAAVHAVEEAALVAAPICRRFGVPLIYDMASSLPEQLARHGAVFRFAPLAALLRHIERSTLRGAACVMCSAGLADHVRRASSGVPVHEWVFPAGAPDASEEDVEAIGRELELAPGARVVLYAGTFEGYQGIGLLLEAVPRVLEQIPECIFVLAGARDEPERAAALDRIPARWRERVRVLPRQPRERVERLYALAEILVSVRVHGANMPLKVFDYLSVGRPIVATDVPAHRAVLDERIAVLVEPAAEPLVQGIVALLNDPERGRGIAEAAQREHRERFGRDAFVGAVRAMLERVGVDSGARTASGGPDRAGEPERTILGGRISVVIPARDEASHIGSLVERVLAQVPAGAQVEVVVVDDGSTDGTGDAARAAGARVLRLELRNGIGNPAAARNLGAAESSGDPIVFLDSDCVPRVGWLDALLDAHRRGEAVVGGSLELPPGLPFTARLDYYVGWYNAHGGCSPGPVPSQPPGNLSVRRATFERTCGFTAGGPAAYSHEELEWQGQARSAGERIWFEPRAIVDHYNRPGFGNLMRRGYRWGYTAIEFKAKTRAARFAWLYRHPVLLIAASPLLVFAHAGYVLAAWIRARRLEPVLMLPLILCASGAYCAGLAVGGTRWLLRREGEPGARPRWE